MKDKKQQQAGRVTRCAPGSQPAKAGAQQPGASYRSWLICLALAAATILVYWQVHSFEFVNYDDTDYVSANPTVQQGLSWKNIGWAFTTGHASNWHPVTWLSHMLDCTLFGVRPGAHHLTNLFLHVANTLLLFGLLKKFAGAIWRSAFVAALFALHPLHVESVAWISERKDVLSTFFFLLTLAAYFRYAKKPKRGSYLVVVVLFAVGLMAKPMLVTLPCVLLLLDFWPLKRVRKWPALVLEKLPMFAMVVGSSIATYFAQKGYGAVQSVSQIPIADRVANAFLSYARYLEKMFWPQDLAIPYIGLPLDMWHVSLGAVFVCGSSFAAFKFARARPYFFVGWFWFLGTLVPVIGLMQVGSQSMADRYTYIPLIGIFVVIAWGVNELTGNLPNRKIILSAASAVVLVACAAVSWRQIQYWRNTEALFIHATSVMKKNYFAHYNLGNRYLADGKAELAVEQYQAAVRSKPDYANAFNNLGNALDRLGKTNEAATAYEQALKLSGGSVMARVNMANSLASAGKVDEAIRQYNEALRADPNSVEAHNGLGVAFANQKKFPEAIAEFEVALKANPKFLDARRNLDITVQRQSEAANDAGLALAMQGKVAEALPHFREAVRINPQNAAAFGNLGNALGVLDKTDEAVQAFESSVKLDPNDAQTRFNFSIALAKLGRRDDAIAQLREALRLKPDYVEAQKQLEQIDGRSSTTP